MKTYKYLLFSILVMIVFSCQDEWLAPKPLSIFTPESIYVDKEGLQAELLTCRKALRPEFYGAPGPLACEMVSTDIAICGEKANEGAHNYFTQLTPTGAPGDYNFFYYWDNAYSIIKDANLVISRIDDVTWNSEQDRNEILAEGYFHRAYWYYRMVHQFGDVPFLNKEYTTPKLDFYSHSRKTILAKIQEDMEFAVKWLPEVVDPGKVNRAAGYHLLTKIYLANSQFDEAITAASAVINDGKYSLMTQRFGIVKNNSKFNVVWDLHQKENKSLVENTEKILVVQDRYEFPTANQRGGTKAMRNYVPTWWHSAYIKDPDNKRGCTDNAAASSITNPELAQFGRGVAYVRPTNYFCYEIWNDINDLRHSTDTNWVSVSKIWYNNPESNYYGQPVNRDYIAGADTFQAYFPWPQYKVHVDDEEILDKPQGGHSDWYVFRLAETYLLRAEAYYWKGNMASAAADINVIRTRSGAAPVSAGDVTINYILDERARELYAEEPRKTELTRISFIMADNNLNGYILNNFSEKNFWYDRLSVKNNFYNIGFTWGTIEFAIGSYHVLWPIPQKAIDSNTGGRINQNEGYPGTELNIAPKTEITDED